MPTEYSFDSASLRRGVDVWPVIIDDSAPADAEFLSMLDPEEIDRAARFRFEHLRSFYVGAHVALRLLLARYTEIPADEIRFRYSSRGKPSIAQNVNLAFNISHSGTLMLVALSSGCDVGVDVEQIRLMRDVLDIAKRFFCREEIAELESLPQGEQERGFFNCWVQKEAFLKTTGEGLSTALDSFCVPLRPGTGGHVVQNCIVHALGDLEFPEGYVGAVAYNDGLRMVRKMPVTPAAALRS